MFPVLHGPNGEDGTVQGLLELAGVPYVGSGVLGSALAMDKAKAKEVLAQHGLPQARHAVRCAWEIHAGTASEVADELGFPMFVKPANMGSSIGVSKVVSLDGLDAAIELALRHDEIVVFEEGVDGREIEIGVLGNESPRTSVVGEIVPGADFYTYADKYEHDDARLLIPAPLTSGQADEVRALAVRAFEACRVEAMARVDFFLDEAGTFLVNELNTIPGFVGGVSQYPRLWEASGVPYPELLDRLIGLAFARHERRTKRAGRQRDGV